MRAVGQEARIEGIINLWRQARHAQTIHLKSNIEIVFAVSSWKRSAGGMWLQRRHDSSGQWQCWEREQENQTRNERSLYPSSTFQTNPNKGNNASLAVLAFLEWGER